MPAQFRGSRSGVWEPGNEAMSMYVCLIHQNVCLIHQNENSELTHPS